MSVFRQAVNGQGDTIPKEYGFFASFSIPAGAMFIAVIVFVIGTPRYVIQPPQGSALSRFWGVFWKAGRRSKRGRFILGSLWLICLGMILTITSYFILVDSVQTGLAIAAMLCIGTGVVVIMWCAQTTEWLEAALDGRSSSDDMDAMAEAAEVCRLLPYLGFLIMFWACYGQMNNNFQIQGCQMNLHWSGGTSGSQMSAAFLNVFDSAVIMVFIPLFDAFVYPLIDRVKGSPMTVLQKIGVGFLFCAAAMATAGVVELWRGSSDNIVPVPLCCAESKGPCEDQLIDGVNRTAAYIESELCPYNSVCASDKEVLPMSKVSIWWQIPQFLLIGVGEIFTSISSYELFYSQVPTSMRSVCQALNLLTTSIGFMVTGGINSVFAFWIEDNIDDGHLANVFFIVSGLTVATFVGYAHISRTFVYKEDLAKSIEQQIASGLTPDVMANARAARGRKGSFAAQERERLLKEERLALGVPEP